MFYNICIHAFGKWKRLDKSLKLFSAMKAASPPLVPDICTHNSVILVPVIGGRVADALLGGEQLWCVFIFAVGAGNVFMVVR